MVLIIFVFKKSYIWGQVGLCWHNSGCHLSTFVSGRYKKVTFKVVRPPQMKLMFTVLRPRHFFLPHQKVIIGTFGEKFSFFWQKSKKIKEFSANFQSLRLVRSLWPSSDEKHRLTPFFLHVCLHIEDHGHVITLHREYRSLKKVT